MAIETKPFDAAEHLETDEDIGAYLKEVFDDGDPATSRPLLMPSF
jgi:DNA-binding phage protein